MFLYQKTNHEHFLHSNQTLVLSMCDNYLQLLSHPALISSQYLSPYIYFDLFLNPFEADCARTINRRPQRRLFVINDKWQNELNPYKQATEIGSIQWLQTFLHCLPPRNPFSVTFLLHHMQLWSKKEWDFRSYLCSFTSKYIVLSRSTLDYPDPRKADRDQVTQ